MKYKTLEELTKLPIKQMAEQLTLRETFDFIGKPYDLNATGVFAKIGYSQMGTSKLLKNKRPSIDVAMKLADALEVDLMDILYVINVDKIKENENNEVIYVKGK